MANRSLGTLLKEAQVLQKAAKLTKDFGQLNDRIIEILTDHLEKVKVSFDPKRPHVWEDRLAVLQVVYGRITLKIPVPELKRMGQDQQHRIKTKMNINKSMTSKSASRLFDGLTFNQAIAVYRRVLEMAKAITLPVDDNFKFLGFTFNSSVFWSVMRDNVMDDSPSLAQEVFTSFIPSREKYLSMGELLVDLLGAMMRAELFPFALEVLNDCPYQVEVSDVTRIGVHKAEAESLLKAFDVRESLMGEAQNIANGNGVLSSTLTCEYGSIKYPPHGRIMFFPADTFAGEITEEDFKTLVIELTTTAAEINRLMHIIRQETCRTYKAGLFASASSDHKLKSYTFMNAYQAPFLWSIQVSSSVFVGSADLWDLYKRGILEAWAESAKVR